MILALGIGGDDYICKPYSLGVLLAKVKAALKRYEENRPAAAKNDDELRVRFRENTLVVTSTQMEEARLYSMQGKLLQKERGNFIEFELDRGTYRLYAKVNGETVTRRVELR